MPNQTATDNSENELARFGIEDSIPIPFEKSIKDLFEWKKHKDFISHSRDWKTLKLKNPFFEGKLVPNVWRYNLVWNKNKWELVNPQDGNTEVPKFYDKSKFHDVEIRPSKNNILIILESPHKDEYTEKDFLPKAPAQGSTGDNIQELFAGAVIPVLISFSGLELDKAITYRICIVNPVPFQSSLHYFKTKSSSKIKDNGLTKEYIRNQVWRSIFQLTKADFRQKVKDSLSQTVVIACTGGDIKHNSLNKDIFDVVKNLDGIDSIYKTPHPSYWYYFMYFEKLA